MPDNERFDGMNPRDEGAAPPHGGTHFPHPAPSPEFAAAPGPQHGFGGPSGAVHGPPQPASVPSYLNYTAAPAGVAHPPNTHGTPPSRPLPPPNDFAGRFTDDAVPVGLGNGSQANVFVRDAGGDEDEYDSDGEVEGDDGEEFEDGEDGGAEEEGEESENEDETDEDETEEDETEDEQSPPEGGAWNPPPIRREALFGADVPDAVPVPQSNASAFGVSHFPTTHMPPSAQPAHALQAATVVESESGKPVEVVHAGQVSDELEIPTPYEIDPLMGVLDGTLRDLIPSAEADTLIAVAQRNRYAAAGLLQIAHAAHILHQASSRLVGAGDYIRQAIAGAVDRGDGSVYHACDTRSRAGLLARLMELVGCHAVLDGGWTLTEKPPVTSARGVREKQPTGDPELVGAVTGIALSAYNPIRFDTAKSKFEGWRYEQSGAHFLDLVLGRVSPVQRLPPDVVEAGMAVVELKAEMEGRRRQPVYLLTGYQEDKRGKMHVVFPTKTDDLQYRCVQGIVDGLRVKFNARTTNVYDEAGGAPFVLSRLMQIRKRRKPVERPRSNTPKPGANVFLGQDIRENAELVIHPTPTWVLEPAPVALASARFESDEDVEERLIEQASRVGEFRERLRNKNADVHDVGTRPRAVPGSRRNRPAWF